ncbi:hypothetical protein BN1723_003042, partial [Verticillium longisporum]
MANYSPYTGSTPGEEYYYARERFQSATPTPSPRGNSYYASGGSATPQRPATRAHFRNASTGYNDYSPRPPTASPRYTSDGYYATANVSSGHHSRKASWATPTRPKNERRSSYIHVRSSTPHGESDEDEIIEIDGRTYVISAKHQQAEGRRLFKDSYFDAARGHPTDSHYYMQGGYSFHDRDAAYEPQSNPQPRARPTANTHARRSSVSVPQRPATARPASSHKKPAAPAAAPKATEADAKRHRIPPGYSLKNWDPAEEPILLLGSVFDANSLGKWIYDWTVYHHGTATPISDVAGELWLLLIQLAGKIKRADEVVERIRSAENKDLVEDFIDSGERLQDKLRKLLKTCEQPMLKASSKKSSLGKNAGVEFVETLFGRERELDRTERFMQGVRVFNHRFDANCEEILRNPTK